MEWYEAAFDRTYPILYPHRSADEAFAAIDTFSPYLNGATPVLDLASGGGRYLEGLRRRDYTAFGLDLSLFLLERSLERWGHDGRLALGDMRVLPFVDASFGAVINMFTSFGYFSLDTDNLLVFREVQRVLKPGGVFLFDFINAEKIAANLLAESQRESAGYDITERRQIEGHGKFLVKRASLRHSKTGAVEEIEERLRLYTHDDLLTMFASVGLDVDGIFGDYHGNDFVEGVSERVIMVTRKQAAS